MPVILLRPSTGVAAPVSNVPTFFGRTIVPADTEALLSAVVEAQYTDTADLTSYTTGSITPVSGALYIAFARARVPGIPYRTPTLVGTNGWNVTWTRIPAAQSVYQFVGIDRGGIDVFWGVASSAVAGTLTFDYGAGTAMTTGTLHLIRIDGGPDTTAPIGATASAHDDTATVSSLNATLTALPRSTSIVVACSQSDLNTGTMTPGTGYTTLGTVQVGGSAGISQPEYDRDPTSTTVGATWSGNDIISISAVEVRVPVPALQATSVVITPPTAMSLGDLVVILGIVDDAFTPVLSIAQSGGQTWIPIGVTQYGIGVAVQRWWCRFNGAWSGPLEIAQNSVIAVMTGAMFVWRPSDQGVGWVADSNLSTFPSDASAPFDLTISSQAVRENSEVCLAEWHGDFITAMALQTAGWANPASEDQWRNDTVGGDIILSAAYKIQNAGVSGAVSNRALDAAGTITQGASYMSFYELIRDTVQVVKPQARQRASRR
jgi:hypothetical protein